MEKVERETAITHLSLTFKLCHRLLAASVESEFRFKALMAISSPERQPVDSSALCVPSMGVNQKGFKSPV